MPSVVSQKHAKRAYCGLSSTFYAAFLFKFRAVCRRRSANATGLSYCEIVAQPSTGRAAFEIASPETRIAPAGPTLRDDDSIRGSSPAPMVITRGEDQLPHHPKDRGTTADHNRYRNPPDDLHDDSSHQEARLRGWQKSRFWLPIFG